MGLTGPRRADRANRTDGPPRPTTAVAVSADIEAPVRRVFDLFTDIERAAEHVSAIIAEQDIDLIVMGTRDREGVARVLIGSVAEKVVRSAPCPVLTVHHPEHEFVVPDTA